jgi:putative aldouronate transport system permease protein
MKSKKANMEMEQQIIYPKKKRKIKVFDVILILFFILFSFLILIPLWKVLVDSFDLHTAYGMKLVPKNFGIEGYRNVFTNPTLYRPLIISVVTTIAGTLLGLTLSTLGAYVLIQREMPGRSFFGNMLLFTMIFQGGMIPTYLVINSLGLTNTLWSVILMPGLNVYNLVLMRNFFEGIPHSLFESAEIDGCSPMGIFFKIVLPLSKAALAAIGLMFAVSYWNDYTNYKLYITDSLWYNFQMKLRSIIMGSDLPIPNGGATENTIKNAAIMVAILPFMFIYPFCQKYFVKGVNIGAVKE